MRLVIPGIAVSPGVTHSDSHIVFVISFALLDRAGLKAIRPRRVAHWSPVVGWTRGSGWVMILPDFGGSGQHFEFFSFFLIISWYLNQYEPSNTTFGLIDFLRYLLCNN